ncbi:MAG: glycosyltransferase family 87 protein [Candidatus Omnitrophota bacterium]
MSLNRRLLIAVVIAIVFTGLIFRYAYRAPKRSYGDFRVYYAAGERFAAKEDIYQRHNPSITPYKYSPMFAMLVSPLSLFSQKTASLLFFTLNFFAVLVIFVISKKIITKDKTSGGRNLLLYAITTICSMRFILHTLDSGQVGILIMLLVVSGLYLLEKNRQTISASLISLSLMFKYTTVIFPAYFAFKKRRKLLMVVLAFIIFYCLLPALHVGIEKDVEYVKNWIPFIAEHSLDKSSLYDYKNQSLYSFLLRLLTRDTPYTNNIANLTFSQGLIISLIIAGALFLLVITPGRGNDSERPLDYSLLLIMTALLNPNAWMHNYVILIFAYMLLLHCSINAGLKDKLTIALIIVSFALTTLAGELFVGDDLERLFEELSSTAIGGLILMFALLRLKWRRALPKDGVKAPPVL